MTATFYAKVGKKKEVLCCEESFLLEEASMMLEENFPLLKNSLSAREACELDRQPCEERAYEILSESQILDGIRGLGMQRLREEKGLCISRAETLSKDGEVIIRYYALVNDDGYDRMPLTRLS